MAPFRKASHTPSPPCSPQPASKGLKRQVSRFHLPKILKRSQNLDSVPPLAHKAIQISQSGSCGPSKGSKHDDPSLPSFRKFGQMTQPPPLTLPVLSMPPSNNELLARTASRKLRKMPKSYSNLRAIRSDNQLASQLTAQLAKVPALLPSPLPSDGEEIEDCSAQFAFRTPIALQDPRPKPAEASYEYEDIVAGYCEDVFEVSSPESDRCLAVFTHQNGSQQANTAEQETAPSSAVTRTPPTSNMSAVLRSPKRDRSSSMSSEATWLSKRFAHSDHKTCIGQLETMKMNEKRLAEKSRRCCHLVQGPNDDLPSSWTGERKAVSRPEALLFITIADRFQSYATVIKPGKANDIWVPRSSSINWQSPSRTGPGDATEEPKTPERKLSEVSAFSPWESPAERRASVSMNGERQGQLRKVATFSNLRYSSNEYTPTRKPLFPPPKSSLGPMFSAPHILLSTSSSASTLTSEFSHPRSVPQSPRGTHVPDLDQTAWTECDNLAKILDEIEQSIDDYPYRPLQLYSPVILQIRNPQSLDELHIDRLRRIFPDAKIQHLSSLAAMLMAQSYLAKFSNIPEPPSLSKYSRLAASSNESLNNMPTKAITTLGIRMANVTSVQERERALRKRAKAVEATLHVNVQKIMVAICGKYDEIIWRTLKCLVETVEQG
jgi:hypothetical protein